MKMSMMWALKHCIALHNIVYIIFTCCYWRHADTYKLTWDKNTRLRPLVISLYVRNYFHHYEPHQSNSNPCIPLQFQPNISQKPIYDWSKMILKAQCQSTILIHPHSFASSFLPSLLHCGQRLLSVPDLCRTITTATSDGGPWMHLVLFQKRSAFRVRESQLERGGILGKEIEEKEEGYVQVRRKGTWADKNQSW